VPLSNMILVSAAQTQLLALGGEWEVPHSRRRIDLIEAAWVRSQYEGGAGNCAVRIDYSLDEGANWTPLVPVGPNFQANTMMHTDWADLPSEPMFGGDMIVRAVAVASVGLTMTLYYVQLDWR
jgi:hypothetical protein